jgi:murein DD-endopeptidase MepM/ murein hydrolase activator NlpD
MTPALLLAAALTVNVHARALQPGEPVRLDITSAGSLSDVRVRAFDVETPAVRVDGDRHWSALIGIDLDVQPGRYTAVVSGTTAAGVPVTERVALAVTAKAFPTRRLTVDPNFVNPPADVLPRIVAEQQEMNAIWSASDRERHWTTFVRPVPQRANSAFGTRSIFNGEPRSAHSGADFLSPAGTPIQAPAAGRVVLARNLYYSGNAVIIDHGLGVFSFLAHMSRIDAKVGDEVAPGDVVGLVGATGRVTGPHLHWTMRVAGARVDPLAVLGLFQERREHPVAHARVERARVAGVALGARLGLRVERDDRGLPRRAIHVEVRDEAVLPAAVRHEIAPVVALQEVAESHRHAG